MGQAVGWMAMGICSNGREDAGRHDENPVTLVLAEKYVIIQLDTHLFIVSLDR